MRRRGSIVSWLLIAFSVFAMLIVIAGVTTYVALRQHDSESREITGRDFVIQQEVRQLRLDFSASQLAISDFAISGRGVALRDVPRRRADFAHQVAQLRQLAPPSLRGSLETQAQAGARLFEIGGKLLRIQPHSPAATALGTRVSPVAWRFYLANSTMREQLDAEVRAVTKESTHTLTVGLAWATAALGVAVVLVLAGSLSTLGTITRPLRALAATVRRLTSGDYAARAPVAGSAEVREVAQAVNVQADESDRLRSQEAESNRLRAMARAAGIRIREPLNADQVLEEARTVLERNVDADTVYLQLVTDGQINPPIGHADGVSAPQPVPVQLTSGELERMKNLFRGQTSIVVQDFAAEEGRLGLPHWASEAMRNLGVHSFLLTPFGVGDELLGFVVASRRGQPRPWTAAEVDAVESITADLGRGLHHARLYEAENRLVEDLKSLDAAKSDFFATVAHELRAPLTSIEGYVEMLGDEDAGPVTARQLEMLDTIDRSAVRLRDLIDDVFTLSKLESGAFAAEMRLVDLAEVISGAAEMVQPSVMAGGLTFVADYPGQGMVVRGDPAQLNRVMVNLFSNSVKFTPQGGQVEVTGRLEGEWALVEVSDTGIGVPEQDQAKLFTRFFRASNAIARSISGTGLGLAIVRTIVDNHGGQVRLESREGEGTHVTIRLPLLATDGRDEG